MSKKSQYKILEVIGLGSFGQVFSALDLQTRELVALKELGKKQLSTSDFLQELFCLTTLDHPNIVTFRGLEHSYNRRYLIMDYCEGGTLRNLLISDNQVGVLKCLDIIMQILSALEFAHQKEVVHRDIKPANILLKISCSGWHALLSDFGIAAIASKISDKSLGFTGSPAYMAPEQFYGKFSVHSDLYSVGILLYELVVGERPFAGTPKDLLKAHLSEPVIVPDYVPFLIKNIIFIALKKSPDQRFKSAKSMKEAVEIASTILRDEYNFQSNLFSIKNIEEREIKIFENKSIYEPIDRLYELDNSSYLACSSSFQEQTQLNNQFKAIATKSLKINANEKIVDLQICKQNYLLSQKSLAGYRLIYFNFVTRKCCQVLIEAQKILAHIFKSKKQEHLMVSSYSQLDRQLQCQIFNTVNLQKTHSFKIAPNLDGLKWDLNPLQVLNLNSYHSIAFYRDRHNLQTSLQVFNHRGHWVANFLLTAAINAITVNAAFNNFILATDFSNSKSVFIINLKSCQVERVALSINPVYLISGQKYFIWADKQGSCVIYDVIESTMFRHKFVLPNTYEIRAIACNQNLELIASTWSSARNQGSLLKGKFLDE